MTKYLMKFIIIFLFLIFLFSNIWPNSNNSFFDLSNINLNNQVIELKGNWNFLWNSNTNYTLISVPSGWNAVSTNYNRYGSALYNTKIYTINTNQVLALNIKQINSCYDLYINNILVLTNGSTSNKTQSWKPITYYFYNTNQLIDLKIYVINKDHSIGGIERPIYIGSSDSINKKTLLDLAFELLLLGSLFITAIYHLFIFFTRKKELVSLLFSLFSFATCERIFVTSERFIYNIIPNIDFSIVSRLDHLSSVLCAITFLFYTIKTFNERINKFLMFHIFIFVIFGIFYIFTPIRFYTYWNIIGNFNILITLMYSLYVVLKNLVKGNKNSILFLIGFITIFVVTANDIMVNNLVYKGFLMFPIGMFLFSVIHNVNLAINYSKSFNKVETLSNKISDLNKTLESKVNERTEKLNNLTNELREKNTELERLASTDYLTDLYNKAEMTKILENQIYEWSRYHGIDGFTFTLAFIDLDNFKYYNDVFGHDVGDFILKEFSKLLKMTTRASDYVARFGGDEFVIIMPHTNIEKGSLCLKKLYNELELRDRFSNKLRSFLGKEIDIPDNKLLSFSTGIIEYEGGDSLEECLKKADDNLYIAKKSGKNRII